MEVSGRTKTSGKTDIKNEILCQPCKGEGDEVPAEGYCENCNEYFCTSCLKFHRKMAVTKNHVIRSKDEMPTTQVQVDPCLEPCDTHKTEIVKYFCQEHNSVGCGDCMVIGHKACKVQLVSDVSGNKDNSGEIELIKQKIADIEKKITSVQRDIKNNIKTAEEMKTKIVEEIKVFRNELNSYLDQAEVKLLLEADQMHAKDVSAKNELLKECKSIEKELNAFKQKIHQYANKINNLFVTIKLAEKRLETCQEFAASIVASKSVHSSKNTFEPSKELQALKATRSPIGSLSTCAAQIKKSVENMKALFVKEVYVRTEGKNECWITGMALISCNELLLADSSGKLITVLNVKEGKFSSRYTAPSRPWDVTVINADKCAVTLPDEGMILFLNMKFGLSKSHTLKVRTKCRGIDHMDGILALSFTSPISIQVLTMKGDMLYINNDINLQFPGDIAWRSLDVSFIWITCK
ncbi:transcription intermediary factor 1-alpha-like [Mercenaria mercenaria]|uniref:transcription intermediary factor 1-alpha-like n=1 Tax=Mercenaria mercenaria TaxID=6596 RepID=UPI00234F3EB4|nr:transcription intermediary factor 1-alpha-like [Mercenaria mercenaria]